jgi:hypothetical protein
MAKMVECGHPKRKRHKFRPDSRTRAVVHDAGPKLAAIGTRFYPSHLIFDFSGIHSRLPPRLPSSTSTAVCHIDSRLPH